MPDLAERVQRTRLLLETLHDPLPQVRASLRSDPGPAASRYVPCEACHRAGWIRRRRGVAVLCLACDGEGWRRRQAGEPEWDRYLGLPVQEAVQLPVEAAHRPREPEAGGEQGYGWERLQAAYEARGSYRELRRNLSRLAAHRPRRHRLVVAVLVENQPRFLTADDELDIDLGVVWITLRMRTIRVPPWLMEHEAARTREQTIAALAADGFGAGEIARRLEMPKRTVRKYLARGSRIGMTRTADRDGKGAWTGEACSQISRPNYAIT